MTRRIVGWRRRPIPFRPLSDYMVVGEGAHREVVLRETGKREDVIEPVYEGDPGWEEFADGRAAGDR